MRKTLLLALVTMACLGPPGRADEKSVAEGLKAILAVGKEGAGNEQAATGWKAVVAGGAEALLPTLKAFAGASPTARNWLRTAVAGIADREKAAGRVLPAELLKLFIADRSNDPAARTATFDLLQAAKPEEATLLLDGMSDDPSVELRRRGIAKKLDSAKSDTTALKELFAQTRDFDQVDQIAKLLEEKGEKIDLNAHFGYLATWHLCGPFDSTDGVGFAKSFPAEAGFDPSKTFTGKGDTSFGWKTVTATAKAPPENPNGPPKYSLVDLNKELGKSMDAVAYAASQFTVEKETPCEIRVGSQNAVQIFLNGKKLFEREAYHHGFYPDQHSCSGTLKAGMNEIVLKVAQNNMKEPWAQVWNFNLRVCDSTGGKLPITPFVPPMPNKEEKK